MRPLLVGHTLDSRNIALMVGPTVLAKKNGLDS